MEKRRICKSLFQFFLTGATFLHETDSNHITGLQPPLPGDNKQSSVVPDESFNMIKAGEAKGTSVVHIYPPHPHPGPVITFVLLLLFFCP